MPVLRYIPVNPTELYVQGEQLRSVALFSYINENPNPYLGVVNYSSPADSLPMISNDENVLNMQGADWSQSTDLSLHFGLLNSHIRANSTISAPTGALIPIPFGVKMLGAVGSALATSTGLFVITGLTKDSSLSPLGNCRVVALETGRIEINGAPVVAETVSDGSGNYSITVPSNVAFQLLAYKPGSPDVAGITRSDVAPAQV
jgi:hypothetical protein